MLATKIAQLKAELVDGQMIRVKMDSMVVEVEPTTVGMPIETVEATSLPPRKQVLLDKWVQQSRSTS
jgi:hypothetical protein